MLLPIVAYPHAVLKKVAEEITPDYPGVETFLADMWETMYHADGVGLAAPQVNRSVRLFVIDATALSQHHHPEAAGFKKTFINAEIYMEEGEEDIHNEGCLSFPGLHEDILRKSVIHIRYLDEQFQEHDERYEGILARIIQHEYDHIEGVTMADRISPLKKMLLKRRLKEIAEGNVEVHYKMIFPGIKRGKR
ncbi:MAG: peptide deformylase [Bacteroidales bacterium]|nr:peptide deformylase [Bacteroidales bacterium]